MCCRLNTCQLYNLQVGQEVLWCAILWTGTAYNRFWNSLLCLRDWMNSVKHKVISELPRNLSRARAKVSCRAGDLKWQRPLDEKDAQSCQWGRKKKSFHGAGQRTGSLGEKWDNWILGGNSTFVNIQLHVYSHPHFSCHPSVSEWCLKLGSITSPWETLLLKLSSRVCLLLVLVSLEPLESPPAWMEQE